MRKIKLRSKQAINICHEFNPGGDLPVVLDREKGVPCITAPVAMEDISVLFNQMYKIGWQANEFFGHVGIEPSTDNQGLKYIEDPVLVIQFVHRFFTQEAIQDMGDDEDDPDFYLKSYERN